MMIKVTAVVILLCKVARAGDARYECGPHGRFEYCIDGIPGCVIGCHCHPGYYFDSDTKICEANTKLAQDVKRNLAVTLSNDQVRPATTVGTNDEDIGDWLYNQFFKTIENQVINQTSTNSLTRRSGKKTKRSKKKGKKSKLKMKKRLRMDENDSVFKSASVDESSRSSSSETDSDSGSSSTDTDRDSSDESRRHKSAFDHKHFMMINRNRPPLPSFVFMPNMHTPYFPPLGLPPPMPPMFPVLPAPPLIQTFPICKDEDNTTSASTPLTTAATESKSQDHSTAIPVNPVTAPSLSEEKENKNSNENPGGQSLRMKKNNGQRKHRMGRKRIKPMTTRKYTKPSPFDSDMNNQLHNPTGNMPNNNFYYGDLAEDYNMENGPLNYNDYGANQQQPVENVKFKYLSDLIHKDMENVQPNSAKPKLNVFNDPVQQPVINVMQRPLLQTAPGQRLIGNKPPSPNILRHQDESYYINLGREIATLIRKIDSKGERQVNIEIEQIPKRTPVYNDNSFGANSHWERPIRSPIDPNETEFPRNYYVKSDEMLFELENMAKVVATTAPTLDLAQIEEVLWFMDLTRLSEPSTHQQHKPLPNKYVNVNAKNNKLNKSKLVDKINSQNIVLKPAAENSVKNKGKIKNNVYQSNRPMLEFFEYYPNRDHMTAHLNVRGSNAVLRTNTSSTAITNATFLKSNKDIVAEASKQYQKPMQSINFETFMPFVNRRKYHKKVSNLSPFPFSTQFRKRPATNRETASYFHQFDLFF